MRIPPRIIFWAVAALVAAACLAWTRKSRFDEPGNVRPGEEHRIRESDAERAIRENVKRLNR